MSCVGHRFVTVKQISGETGSVCFYLDFLTNILQSYLNYSVEEDTKMDADTEGRTPWVGLPPPPPVIGSAGINITFLEIIAL